MSRPIANVNTGIIPSYFVRSRKLIRQVPLELCLAKLRKHGETIKAGNYQKTADVIELVVGRDFQPEILEAAREALSSITFFKLDRVYPLRQFDLTPLTGLKRSFFLGAFFECLPRGLAVDLFHELFLWDGYAGDATRIGGQALLCFSSAAAAADFLRAAHEQYPKLTLQLLHKTSSWKVVRNYEFRRYDASELKAAFDSFSHPSSKSV
jgi:hypothetical protein